jgi:hypothetical protein
MRMEAYFIQKLIEGKAIPSFHLAKNLGLDLRNPAKSHTMFPETDCEWVIVDGQQRWFALVAFFADELPLPKGFNIVIDDATVELGGKRWSYIRDNYPELRDYILNILIPLVEYVEFEDRSQITDQFDILQRGVPLNGAEKRHAWEGKIGAFVDDVVKLPFFSLGMYGVSNARLKQLEMVEKSLALADLTLTRDVSQKSLDEWRRAAEANFKPNGKEAKLVREFYELAARIWGVEDAAKPQIMETTAIFVLWLRNRKEINRDVEAFGRGLRKVNEKRLNATGTDEPLTTEERLAARFRDRSHAEEHKSIMALVVAYEDCLRHHAPGVIKP